MVAQDELSKQCELFIEKLDIEITQALKHPDHDINKNNYNCMSPKGRYLVEVNGFVCNINELLKDLERVLVFIRRFPNSQYFIDNIDYIKCHLEVLINKVHNILEIMRLTINCTYELNLSKSECSWNNLRSKLDINNSVMQILDLYYKSFKNVIELRHSIVHQGNDVDPITTDMKSYLSLLRVNSEYSKSFSTGNKEEQIQKLLLRFEVKNYKKQRVEFVKSVIHTSEYYTDLFRHYIYKEACNQAMLKG